MTKQCYDFSLANNSYQSGEKKTQNCAMHFPQRIFKIRITQGFFQAFEF